MPTDCRQTLSSRRAPWAIPLILVLGLGTWWCASMLLRANSLADYSAHMALTKEIHGLLAAVPPGQPYPESLSELKLTYPDGGDASLLERYEYRSNGTSCTLKTVLAWDGDDRTVISRSYPADAGLRFDDPQAEQ
jgi:hypothetical protein